MNQDERNNSLYTIHTVRAGRENANELPQAPDGRKICRIWTLLNEDKLREFGPEHNSSAFLEDYLHDCNVDKEGRLLFFSRLAVNGQDVRIVLDYETDRERDHRRKLEMSKPRFDPMTGKKLRP